MTRQTAGSGPRSGKGLAVLLLSAILVVAAGIVPGTVTGRSSLSEISPYHWQLNLAISRGNALRTIAVGDSHTGLGFHPPVDGSVMNVAWPDALLDLEVRLDWLLQRLSGVEIILLQFQPHMFMPHRERSVPSPLSQSLSARAGTWHPLATALPQFDVCCRASLPRWLWDRSQGRQRVADPLVQANGYLDYHYVPSHSLEEQARREIESYGELRFLDFLVSRYERLRGAPRQGALYGDTDAISADERVSAAAW